MATQSALKTATIAGLAGAGIGLLFAPRSGRETRDKLRMTGSRMKHQAGEKLESARHKVEESAREAKEMKDRAGQAMMAGKESAKQKYSELRDNKQHGDIGEQMPSDLPTNMEGEV